MCAITEAVQDVLERTRQAAHALCVVCSRAAECGLGLRFSLRDDGGVGARIVRAGRVKAKATGKLMERLLS
jgi:hypothetical protein